MSLHLYAVYTNLRVPDKVEVTTQVVSGHSVFYYMVSEVARRFAKSVNSGKVQPTREFQL